MGNSIMRKIFVLQGNREFEAFDLFMREFSQEIIKHMDFCIAGSSGKVVRRLLVEYRIR